MKGEARSSDSLRVRQTDRHLRSQDQVLVDHNGWTWEDVEKGLASLKDVGPFRGLVMSENYVVAPH